MPDFKAQTTNGRKLSGNAEMICAVSAGSYWPDAQVGALDSGTLAGTLGKASLERLGLIETQSIGLRFKSLGFRV